MRGSRPDGRGKPHGTVTPGPPPGKKPAAPASGRIPVCLGEFGFDEAEGLCPLWEATWSQDARGKPAKE